MTETLGIQRGVKTIIQALTKKISKIAGSNKQEYVGEALPGSSAGDAVWRIQKVIWDGNFITDIKWAGGTGNFTYEWDKRTTYDYS